ncbi:peptidoglycan-binding protein [Adlercreutzia sp. R25]|uniref:peptidoglycan recognition protein family protein n=1 Tax=Adlercreutzia shanghongiae TaxID=3111773 RepID=UPI002DBD22F5|nr:peptidoglycan-binding protein [Adlercreutzia sp. R25]MEC4272971.1 peptidoglycan-binding protein [Adlercreutzia sp. R25]
MSDSPLVVYTKLSPNCSVRTQEITKITPHHMSGNLSIETCGNVFAPASRKASSNYGIDTPGRVGMYVPEDKRAWTSSSAWNDQRAVTIEVANSVCKSPWPISDAAWSTLVDLCVDIVRRNPGIVRADGKTPGLNYTGDKHGSLTKHKFYSNTDCPGTWLDQHMKELEVAVNKKLDSGQSTPKPAATAPTPKPSAPKPAAPKPAAKGNANVLAFQKWMNKTYGWRMAEDGLFGKDTKKHAVMALQTELNRQCGAGLAVDGSFGPKTKRACINVRQGAKGNITRVIQGMLYCLGYDPKGLDGSYGPGCAEAVKKFQTKKGLSPDKVCGPNTFAALLG